MLDEVLQQTSDELLKNDIDRSWHNRRVLVVDGTGLSMPDTEANQEIWPQSRNQKPGCGFASARLCACFDLHTDASPLCQISVKASLQALRQWEPLIGAPEADKTGEKQRLMSLLYKAIAGATVPARPGRREPRCVKRRPKPYQLMSAPRASMVELEHRGKSRGKKL